MPGVHAPVFMITQTQDRGGLNFMWLNDISCAWPR